MTKEHSPIFRQVSVELDQRILQILNPTCDVGFVDIVRTESYYQGCLAQVLGDVDGMKSLSSPLFEEDPLVGSGVDLASLAVLDYISCVARRLAPSAESLSRAPSGSHPAAADRELAWRAFDVLLRACVRDTWATAPGASGVVGDKISRAAHAVECSEMPLWALPTVFEELLWSLSLNEVLSTVISALMDVSDARENVVGSQSDGLRVHDNGWPEGARLLAVTHAVRIGPIGASLAKFPLCPSELRRTLIQRFSAATCEQIQKASIDLDECGANIVAGYQNFHILGPTLKWHLAQLLAETANTEGRLRARMALREVFAHRLAIPRTWFDELDKFLSDPASVFGEHSEYLQTLSERSLQAAQGPLLETRRRQIYVVGHMVHESSHALRNGWIGFNENRSVDESMTHVLPALKSLIGGSVNITVTALTGDLGGQGHELARFIPSRNEDSVDTPQQTLENIEAARTLIRDALLSGGEMNEVFAQMRLGLRGLLDCEAALGRQFDMRVSFSLLNALSFCIGVFRSLGIKVNVDLEEWAIFIVRRAKKKVQPRGEEQREASLLGHMALLQQIVSLDEIPKDVLGYETRVAAARAQAEAARDSRQRLHKFFTGE